MEFKIVKWGRKYTIMASINGVNTMVKGCGYYNTKTEAKAKLNKLISEA